MNIKQLIDGTLEVVPLTRDRWKTRVIRLEGKKVNKTFNTVLYRSLSYGGTRGSGVYIQSMMFSGSGLGASEQPKKGSKVRCKCSCLAYRYFFANANLKGGAFYGNPDKWAKVASKRNNTKHIPGFCKHLVAMAYVLFENGEIK